MTSVDIFKSKIVSKCLTAIRLQRDPPFPLAAAMQTLSEEQQRIFDLVEEGYSVAITGPAASGKSYLATCITHASVPGATFAAGLRTLKDVGFCHGRSLPDIAGRVLDDASLTVEWLGCKRIIVDGPDLNYLVKLNRICRLLRDSDRPFGGIQVIFAGKEPLEDLFFPTHFGRLMELSEHVQTEDHVQTDQ